MFKLLITMLLACSFAAATTLQLNNDNNVNLRGEVNDESVNKWQMQLSELNAKRGNKGYPIYLSIDSGGGSIEGGLAFIEYAKTISNLHTITLFGASMASGIQQALPGKRYVLGTSITMFHRAKGGFQGQFGEGEVESRLNMAKDMVNLLEQANASRMKMSIADYKKAVQNELWFAGGSKNVIGNAADELVSLVCSNELIQSSTIESFQVFIFSISVRFSNCPLFRSGTVLRPTEDAYLKNKAAFQRKMTGVYYLQAGSL